MPTLPNRTPATVYELPPSELVRSLLRLGWSQEKLAAALEVTQPTVSRILSGAHKDPRYSVVEKLRRLLLTVDTFSMIKS